MFFGLFSFLNLSNVRLWPTHTLNFVNYDFEYLYKFWMQKNIVTNFDTDPLNLFRSEKNLYFCDEKTFWFFFCFAHVHYDYRYPRILLQITIINFIFVFRFRLSITYFFNKPLLFITLLLQRQKKIFEILFRTVYNIYFNRYSMRRNFSAVKHFCRR